MNTWNNALTSYTILRYSLADDVALVFAKNPVNPEQKQPLRLMRVNGE